MNLLVISDSHRAAQEIRKLLTVYRTQVSAVIHLGDHVDDLLRFRDEFPNLKMETVIGNCDSGSSAGAEKMLTVSGRKILLLHGHKQNVKYGYDRLMYYAEEKEADACLFGHTHEPVSFDMGAVQFFNPGSLGRPNPGGIPSYGLMTVSETGVIKTTVLRWLS